MANASVYDVLLVEKEKDLFNESIRNEAKPESKYGETLRIVKEAVRNLAKENKEFTIPDIKKWTREKYPTFTIVDPYFNTLMIRLVKKGEVILLKKGKGRRPSIYTQA